MILPKMIWRTFMLMPLIMLLVAEAQAQPFLDDFGDGSVTDGEPVMWGPYIDPWGQGGAAIVIDGDLLLTPDANAPSIPIPWINPNWIDANVLTVDRQFQDVSVHAQARVSGTGQGGFYVNARDTWNDDPVSRGVNVFAGVGADEDPSIRWLMLGGNTPTGELTTQFLQTSLNMHTSDVHLQLDVFGDMAASMRGRMVKRNLPTLYLADDFQQA